MTTKPARGVSVPGSATTGSTASAGGAVSATAPDRAFCEKCSEWYVGASCPRCAPPAAPEPTPEAQLTAALSLLVRTVWDTFAHPISDGQWQALRATTADSVKLLQRLDGAREHCTPPPAPRWTAEGQPAARTRRVNTV